MHTLTAQITQGSAKQLNVFFCLIAVRKSQHRHAFKHYRLSRLIWWVNMEHPEYGVSSQSQQSQQPLQEKKKRI